MELKLAWGLPDLFHRLGMDQVIISPGSRSAPLTIAFARYQNITTRIINDERSAGFIALGIAMETRKPVGLICTSGTALLNYGPAVAEAFFNRVPLVVMSTDRPGEWIGHRDGQTIWQENVLQNHTKGNFSLDLNHLTDDIQKYISQQICESFSRTMMPPEGPVHINFPFYEPLYPVEGLNDDPVYFSAEDMPETWIKTGQADTDQVYALITQSKRVLLIAGQGIENTELLQSLNNVSKAFQIPVVADVISNCQGLEGVISNHDLFLNKNNGNIPGLVPDTVICFGESVISKNLKLFIRKYSPETLIQINPYYDTADPFCALTHSIVCSPHDLFKNLNHKAREAGYVPNEQQKTFYQNWRSIDRQTLKTKNNYFQDIAGRNNTLPEWVAVQEIMNQLPDGANLHLANSMPVRYGNIAGVNPEHKQGIRANRGTSGIDGCVSTAVGSYFATGKLTVLITGDVAFFYDRNAFWHNYSLQHLRVIVLNNDGGNIFRMLPDAAALDELEGWFESPHGLNAAYLAKEFGMEYSYVDGVEARAYTQLKKILPGFFKLTDDSFSKGKILEIFTNKEANHKAYQSLVNIFRQEI